MGLGRSFSVRSASTITALLVTALAAPPPIHNHVAPRAALESHIAHPCTADGATPHLHAARTTPSPDCPACAAGPAAVGTITHAVLAVGPAVQVAFTPHPGVPPAPWAPLHRAARAPPASRPAA